jgi:polyhydroxyalkanoate synthesis repressor PhaR
MTQRVIFQAWRRRTSPPSRLITRYQNRKLYDPLTKSYVTLESLARLIGEGQDVQVLDQKTGEDLTTQVLARCPEAVKEKTAQILARC